MAEPIKISWKGLAIAVSMTLSPIVAAALLILGAMIKASHDLQSTREEIKLTVDPDTLRTWVLEQSQKHPQGGDFNETIGPWPPQLSQVPGLTKKGRACLHPPYEGQIVASFAWNFFDQTLMVVVRLNADGTAFHDPDDMHLRPERQWVQGITFNYLRK